LSYGIDYSTDKVKRRLSRRMMLAGGNAFGLQSFTGGILQELHFSAEVDAVEIRIDQIVAMKIEFASIP